MKSLLDSRKPPPKPVAETLATREKARIRIIPADGSSWATGLSGEKLAQSG